MSLATRCTACGTVFRVVQDQLKVSDGWVRCGRCDAVFNAAEGVFDLEREAPPPWSPTPPPMSAPRAAPEPLPVEDGADGLGGRPLALAASRTGEVGPADGPEPAPLGSLETDTPLPAHDRLSAALARHAGGLVPEGGEEAPLGVVAPSASADHETAAVADDMDAAAPDFVARALRQAFWQGRPVRAALAAAALLLAGGLVAQAAAQYSEIMAARWPASRPAVARWCAVAGCSTAAPRRIEDIVVDTSSLAPVIGSDALKLGVALRNRAAFAVALPSVDLSLTDNAGQLIARRTLHPADFRIDAASIAARAELPLQAMITAGTTGVTGYTVEIFYP